MRVISSSTVNSWSEFFLGVWGQALLFHKPGDWDTDWRADALLTGAFHSWGNLAWTEAGYTATAAQLLRFVFSPPLLVLVLIPAVAPWDRRVDCCWRLSPPFLGTSVAFFAMLEVALSYEALDWLPTTDACIVAFFVPPGGDQLRDPRRWWPTWLDPTGRRH